MQNVFSDINQSEPDPIASLSGSAKCLGMNEIFLYFCQSMKMYIVVLYKLLVFSRLRYQLCSV